MSRNALRGILLTALCTAALSPGLKISLAQRSYNTARYVFTSKEAVLVNRTEILAPAAVHDAAFSPDGTYAAALHETTHITGFPAPGTLPELSDVNITVWYAGSHRTRTLWTDKLLGVSGEEAIQWMPANGTALVRIMGFKDVKTPVNKLVFLNPAREQAREIALGPDERLNVNPVLPMALLSGTVAGEKESKVTFRFIHADGTVGNAVEMLFSNIQEGANGTITMMQSFAGSEWTADGKMVQIQTYAPDPASKKLLTKYYALDPADGSIKPLDKPLITAQKAERPDKNALPPGSVFLTRTTQTVTQDGTNQATHPLWLETPDKSETPRVLISADCESAVLSPKGNAALYVVNGTAFIAPLVRVPKEPIYQMLRAVAMSNAKQVGLGIMMYVQDYDEMFPTKDANVKEVVFPYVKSNEVFEKFVYYYPGESIAKLDKPAETILGAIPGPGGEAVLYADGHVKWRDKK